MSWFSVAFHFFNENSLREIEFFTLYIVRYIERLINEWKIVEIVKTCIQIWIEGWKRLNSEKSNQMSAHLERFDCSRICSHLLRRGLLHSGRLQLPAGLLTWENSVRNGTNGSGCSEGLTLGRAYNPLLLRGSSAGKWVRRVDIVKWFTSE